MRLATVTHEHATVAVAVVDGHAAIVADPRAHEPFADVGALLRAGHEGWDAAASAIARGDFEPLASSTLLRPVLDPGAVVCVGLNYRPHILEMGRDLPEYPTFFSKLPRALADPGTAVVLPAASERVDYEGELAVVIGRGGRDIPAAEAWSAVAGLTLMNDVSMRDYQYRTLQWFAGKSWEEATPVGPVLVTVDELEPLGERELRVEVNGELRQHARLGDLVFDVPSLVADLSRIVTLRAGDLIATGTPGGVGDGMEPKRNLQHRDVVTVSVTGMGTLENAFVRS